MFRSPLRLTIAAAAVATLLLSSPALGSVKPEAAPAASSSSSSSSTSAWKSHGAATTVYFVRHGQTLFNTKSITSGWSDSPLTAKGEAQATAAGKALKKVRFDAALTSDLGRAEQTTALILKAARSKVTPVGVHDLREQYYGGFEGSTDVETWTPIFKSLGFSIDPSKTVDGDMWSNPDMLDAYYSTPPDKLVDATAAADPMGLAEDWKAYSGRLQAAAKDIAKVARAHPGGNVLVVSHGGALGTLFELIDPDGYNGEDIGNASITKATFKNGKFTLVEIAKKPPVG